MESSTISHYEIRRLIGRGGMGEVYEAVDLTLGRAVALKFIAPGLASDPESARRFETEARSAAALTHPNIATLYAYEQESGRPFIAMELVTGESVSDRIRAGPLPVADALAIARDVASALAFAHRRGIVHRDIKPDNLMFDEHGTVKIMDFGLARALLASRVTVTGSSLGTPSYMSPESLQAPAGPASDVFALGVVLYEMLAGRRPFEGESVMSIMFAIANVDPPPLREARPDLPEAVEDLARRMLIKDPGQRPDAATVARELATLTGTAPPAIESPTAETKAEASPAAAEEAPRTLTVRLPKRGRLTLAGVAVVAIVAGIVIALVASGRRKHQEAVILNNQGRRALGEGNIEEAQSHLDAALRKDPDYGPAIINLGTLYLLKGQADSAAAQFTRAIREQPKDRKILAEAYYNLAEVDMRAENWNGAVSHLERSFVADSSSASVYNNYGLALVMAGRAGDAMPLLERAVSRFPNVAAIQKNAGLAALEMNRSEDAKRFLDRALELEPDQSAARALRARLRAQQGDLEGAAADLRAYLQGSPPPAERDAMVEDLRRRGVTLDGGQAPPRR